MEMLIGLLIIASILLILGGIFGSEVYGVSRPKLPKPEAYGGQKRVYSFLGVIFPSRKLLELLKLDGKIKNKLNAAHVKLTAPEFVNVKILCMLAFTTLAYFVTGKIDYWLFAGVAAGFIIPEIWLKQKLGQRKNAIARILPETVDLLGLCVEAGLDFTTALKWILSKTPMNPMLEELAFVLEEIKWGKSRVQALKDMSKRLDIPEVSSFVQTLVQAERMGTPVAEAFMILSEDTRLMRFHRGERFAMQAPIKILIPLIFCILPVIAIVIGGPILLEFMQGKLF